MNEPNLEMEAEAFKGFDAVLAADEVGRGCAAGPAYVGVCRLDSLPSSVPQGVKDSKLLTPRQRQKAKAEIEKWVHGTALGSCSNREIDSLGISLALGLALQRALSALEGLPRNALLILDGNFDYLSKARRELLLSFEPKVKVACRPHADRLSALCACASIMAKLERDGVMEGLSKLGEYKPYKWKKNKGYPTKEHVDAIRRFGLSPLHRTTWKIKALEET